MFSTKHLRVPSLAVLAMAAVPLLAPSGASAAMGGANPVVSTARPALQSATIQNVNTANGTQDVLYCFDRAIASAPRADRLFIGDYDRGELAANSASRASTNCAVGNFKSGVIDVTQFTYATANNVSANPTNNSGAVVTADGNQSNIGDSVALGGSVSSAGTRGITVAPDLTGITINNTARTITYTFDQAVALANQTNVPGVNDFQYQVQDGTSKPSTGGVAGSGTNSLTVTFPALGGANSINNAVRATVAASAVVALSGDPAGTGPNGTDFDTNGGVMSAARPGDAGFTNVPDLVSASVSVDGTKATFVYDENITTAFPQGNASTPKIIRSDARPVELLGSPTTANGGINGNAVTYTIPNGNNINESFVSASSPQGAVGNAQNQPSTPGNAPVGSNAGALSSGFTTAPEALSVSFDTATNSALILLDQRTQQPNPQQFRLLDSSGAVLAMTANSASVLTDQATAQRVTIRVTFNGGIAGGRGVQLLPNAVTSTFGYGNPVQALSPVGQTAARR